MNNVNKTLYIPLYGKAYVSSKGIILDDKKAEEIWAAEGFALKGKSKSKWLAYYMGMRSAVFDQWLADKMSLDRNAVILHIGCGMDSRAKRVGTNGHLWYDIDFPEVIQERRRYYTETENYHMLAADVRKKDWTRSIPQTEHAIVVLEGVSMYFAPDERSAFLDELTGYFPKVSLLMDCYTTFAAKASKYKNPINDVGVTLVYGIDNPREVESDKLKFVCEHVMTPDEKINELTGIEKVIFRKLYSGTVAQKMYRLYEYEKHI